MPNRQRLEIHKRLAAPPSRLVTPSLHAPNMPLSVSRGSVVAPAESRSPSPDSEPDSPISVASFAPPRNSYYYPEDRSSNNNDVSSSSYGNSGSYQNSASAASSNNGRPPPINPYARQQNPQYSAQSHGGYSPSARSFGEHQGHPSYSGMHPPPSINTSMGHHSPHYSQHSSYGFSPGVDTSHNSTGSLTPQTPSHGYPSSYHAQEQYSYSSSQHGQHNPQYPAPSQSGYPPSAAPGYHHQSRYPHQQGYHQPTNYHQPSNNYNGPW